MKAWRRYIRFWGTDIDGDIRDELSFHVERRVEEYLARGLSRADAERAARERLGDLEAIELDLHRHDRSRARRARWSDTMDRLIGDLRVARRSLRRSPAFTTATVAVLALAIGSAAAMFTIYRVVLIDRLPVTAPEQLVVMHPLVRNGTHLDPPFSYLREIARDSATFRAVAGTYHIGSQLVPFTIGTTTVPLAAVRASANYFDVLGVRPVAGRLFRADDAQPDTPMILVLSYAAWRRQFAGDSSVIGRRVTTPDTDAPGVVVGIAPPGLEYPAGIDAWLPLSTDANVQQLQADIIARLTPNTSIAAARYALLALEQAHNPFAGIREKLPLDQYQVTSVEARSFADTTLGTSRPALAALTLAVGMLLLIACMNVGSLVLVRLHGRAREIAIRRAIGASYADVVRLFTIENLLLALAGGVLGTATAVILVRVTAAFAPAQLARRDVLALAAPPIGMTTAITLGALLVFGFAPSLVATRVVSLSALRSGTRTGQDRSSRRARRWLVATQMALAVVLLAGAGLLARSLAALNGMDLGYRPDHLSVLEFTGPPSIFPTNDAVFGVAKALVARLEATPGVAAATSIESMPFRGQSLFIMKLAAADKPAQRDDAPWTPWEFVSPHYFHTFDIPILRGRAFAESDTRGAGNVVIVNETLARSMWPGETAIGKRLVQTVNGSEWTVIGVARDTHFRELKGVGPVAYFDWDQTAPFWNGFIAVRTSQPLSAMLPALRAATRDVNSRLLLWRSETMDELLDAPMAQPRLNAALFAGLSIAALLLSAIGLYGVLASTVRQTTRDIGVRLALGATPSSVLALVFRDALPMVIGGAAVGIVGAIAGARLLSSQLFGVQPVDPLSIGAAAGALVIVCLLAALTPARRAARIDPVDALRVE